MIRASAPQQAGRQVASACRQPRRRRLAERHRWSRRCLFTAVPPLQVPEKDIHATSKYDRTTRALTRRQRKAQRDCGAHQRHIAIVDPAQVELARHKAKVDGGVHRHHQIGCACSSRQLTHWALFTDSIHAAFLLAVRFDIAGNSLRMHGPGPVCVPGRPLQAERRPPAHGTRGARFPACAARLPRRALTSELVLQALAVRQGHALPARAGHQQVQAHLGAQQRTSGGRRLPRLQATVHTAVPARPPGMQCTRRHRTGQRPSAAPAWGPPPGRGTPAGPARQPRRPRPRR